MKTEVSIKMNKNAWKRHFRFSRVTVAMRQKIKLNLSSQSSSTTCGFLCKNLGVGESAIAYNAESMTTS